MSKNLSSKYYQENKEAREIFLKKKKKKKQQYGRKRYKNLPEDENQKLVEYRKKYYRMRKKALL